LGIRIGECVLDSAARRLSRAGRSVHLSPKAFQLLELLLACRPRALSKAEIRDALWPATYVAASSLARVVAELRAALGDDARHPRLVRTIHGFGYAFAGEAATEPQTPSAPPDAFACRLTWGDREILLREGEHVLGRAPTASVWIDSTSVSRSHARIVVAGGRATLEDLRSKNGTFLRGRKLEAPSELLDGDVIAVGPVVLKFRAARATVSTATDVAD
jgi:DNA-binding winged helix-turn-helix (wHTH) protein